jgi:hypothetical protein
MPSLFSSLLNEQLQTISEGTFSIKPNSLNWKFMPLRNDEYEPHACNPWIAIIKSSIANLTFLH